MVLRRGRRPGRRTPSTALDFAPLASAHLVLLMLMLPRSARCRCKGTSKSTSRGLRRSPAAGLFHLVVGGVPGSEAAGGHAANSGKNNLPYRAFRANPCVSGAERFFSGIPHPHLLGVSHRTFPFSPPHPALRTPSVESLHQSPTSLQPTRPTATSGRGLLPRRPVEQNRRAPEQRPFHLTEWHGTGAVLE